MVQVKYKGTNYLLFGKTKIVNGVNEIPDDEFYKLMKYPSFASRISKGVLSVPKNFPLEKPAPVKKQQPKEDVKPEDSEGQELESGEHEEEGHTGDRLSIKKTLKLIQASDDVEYLKDLVDNDDREKVKEAAQKRIDTLETEEKK